MSLTDTRPRNRQPTELPILHIEVEHAGGTEVMDPNSQIMLLVTDMARIAAWEPIPGRNSDITGEPAIAVRTGDLDLSLTVEEYVKLVSHELTPQEFHALMGRYGSFFEIHDDFYDEETGEQMQPNRLLSSYRKAKKAWTADNRTPDTRSH